ncbi:MAG: site-specific integrase, partial [Dysgonamonadaceae bacterium]|nr:site-specific integrase [Dysgonamonadaceae bacterium]
ESLYLDYYPAIKDLKTNRPTRREFLQMYVTPLKDRNGRPKEETRKSIKEDYPKMKYQHSERDMDTIRIAETIRHNRQNEIDKADIYTDTEKEIIAAKKRSEGDFLQFFRQLAGEKKQANGDNWFAALKHLTAYTQKTDKKKTIRFCDITLQWCEGFKNHLLNYTVRSGGTMKTNTAAAYFIKLKIALKTAYKYGYLLKNINADLKSIKEEETRREFLSLDELNALVSTPCTNETVKRAALFSALTGLRHSDIRKMKWGEIAETNGQYTLKYTIQKTNRYDELPISEQAVMLCGERKTPNEFVFDGLVYSAYANKALSQWLGAAGITRNITFHCFRHTFATLQLASGTQITTIQKMLAHKSLNTTLVYAKTLEEAKREAAEKIKLNI